MTIRSSAGAATLLCLVALSAFSPVHSAQAQSAFTVQEGATTLLDVLKDGRVGVGLVDAARFNVVSGSLTDRAGYFQLTNADNTADALEVITVGLGRAGRFEVDNGSNSTTALHARTNGMGQAGFFGIYNPANNAPALHGRTDGSGVGVFGRTYGTGHAAQFGTENPNNTFPTVDIYSDGQGDGLLVRHNGLRTAGAFLVENAANEHHGVYASTVGIGSAGGFEIANADSEAPALHASTTGTGDAATFNIDNAASSAAAVRAETNGTGSAGNFVTNNTANTSPTVHITTDGDSDGILVQHNGTWSAAAFLVQNPANDRHAVYASTAGTGWAGEFKIENQANTNPALRAETNGDGAALHAEQAGTGWGFRLNVSNVNNTREAMRATTNGQGLAGYFGQFNPNSTARAVYIRQMGLGDGFMVNQAGASGDIAVFQSNDADVARIDKNGTGYFNGGTQSSGADVAEAFAVEGLRAAYEPGDVLVISTRTDRTVEKSWEAYSTLVTGVFATKPGVLLTERSLDESLEDLVPMGVVGVIPTKVTGEGGPIKRGDLLVTSSTPGHAMKADPSKLGFGMVLGKALENFDGQGAGLIKVLVNVK